MFGSARRPLAEEFARRLDRRHFLGKVAKASAATAMAVAAGQFVLPGTAAALLECGCSFPQGVRCSGCPGLGCPSGYSSCKTGSQCGPCVWTTGNWVGCSGYGNCGVGYNRCYDCWDGSHCSTTCGCGSVCICCGCCSPADVKAEQEREARALARMNS